MTRFWPVKVAPFFRFPVKVEIAQNDVLTFPNGFLDLSQLLPTFPRAGKVAKTTTFPTFTPYIIGVKLKSRCSKLVSFLVQPPQPGTSNLSQPELQKKFQILLQKKSLTPFFGQSIKTLTRKVNLIRVTTFVRFAAWLPVPLYTGGPSFSLFP